ncbi:amino acid/polyamine/organocation transporter (APC superfamily) [Prauserella shujinwangii]|uniref:Amino acid/polyamine/organocation transporter (APC superfamily) n=1 Tax=Prauserella shujinwangii TaxID=1453103 RepID=A0A2T0M3B7_9PSEU|nr:amino acid permease [Prauserella shujinwangii]PRX51238.1 amino acid/polyamine/organocation transporter (APC superfamily) [Prauserella shujinwangii]
MTDRLARRLGTGDAVVLGLGSMIGAGVFAAFAPAARAAGAGLLAGLAVAALVAYCNATSSARLAARHPSSGGTYVYGKERLGEFWGYLAGWGFVVGKTASCAAMALTVVAYTAPGLDRPWRGLLAVAVVAALTALNYRGVRRSALATKVIVTVSLLVLGSAVLAVAVAGDPDPARLTPFPGSGPGGVLEAAGLLFFAFAGYARLATLGEEVRDPARTIPRAIPLALGLVLVVYVLVALAVLAQLGPGGVGAAADPLARAVADTGWSGLAPVVRAGAALAALGALLALVLGVSRTTLAMARDGHLPRALAAVHPRFGVPHRAEVAVGAVVAVIVAFADVRGAIGFSSFAVLAYYAIANASALTLRRGEGAAPKVVGVTGLAGCVVLAFSLPLPSVLAGVAVLAVGAAVFAARRAGLFGTT